MTTPSPTVVIKFRDHEESVKCPDTERAFEIYAQAIQMARYRNVKSVSVLMPNREGTGHTTLSQWSHS